MRLKSKGFTLTELIITLAITTLVIGVIYTFFISSNKTLTSIEVRAQLQEEGKDIQELLMTIGTESKGISKLVDESGNPIYKYSEGFLESDMDSNNKLKLSLIELILIDNSICILEYDSSTKILSSKIDGVEKILSKNVEEFSIRPLDIRMVNLSDEPLFINCPGLEFNINLKKKKGYSEIDYPITIITKFRNQ
jgi:prepilin-type N-terminal cleavage/methylation domain-containing protein